MGHKRKQYAQDGIDELKKNVDTLLIISNDKVRQHFGNVAISEAFCKADDILATAAKCITDVISSKGHIIVDFADVCTVMREGGRAILGNAKAGGENRAAIAVEEAFEERRYQPPFGLRRQPALLDSEIIPVFQGFQGRRIC